MWETKFDKNWTNVDGHYHRSEKGGGYWDFKNKLPEYCLRATRLLESIPPERNHIVTAFARSGIEVHNAGDTQSLIQLKREYCEKRKCLYCRIGFRLLKRSVNPPP